jgi:RimJ/RimL family protein N-acetyltransferase
MINKKNNVSITEFQIRKITNNDFLNLCKFFEENNVPQITDYFNPFPLNSKTVTRFYKQKKNKYYIGLLNGNIIGFSMIRFMLNDIKAGCFIDYRFQRMGFGTKMYKHLCDETKKIGINELYASVYAKNKISLFIAQRLGFEITEKIKVNNKGKVIEKYLLKYSI